MKGNLRQLLTIALVFFAVVFAQAQVKTYSGVVVSAESGQTMPGVNLKVVGTAIGTSADFDGNFARFRIERPETGIFVLWVTRTKSVVLGDATTLKITLEQDAPVLDDVVIVAYGTAKKKDSYRRNNDHYFKRYRKSSGIDRYPRHRRSGSGYTGYQQHRSAGLRRYYPHTWRRFDVFFEYGYDNARRCSLSFERFDDKS